MPDLTKCKCHVTTAWIPGDKLAKLKILSDLTKVSVSEYIRRGVDLLLEKHGERAEDRTTIYKNNKKEFKSN